VRRRTSWDTGPGLFSDLATFSASGSSIIGSGGEATTDGLTIVRTRGLIELTFTAATSALDGFAGALGMGICTAEAFAIGVTAVPTPVTDVAWDGWLWHQFYSAHMPAAFQATGTGPYSTMIEVDCKAMRKMDAGDTLFFVGEFTEIGAAILTVRADSRVLVKLP